MHIINQLIAKKVSYWLHERVLTKFKQSIKIKKGGFRDSSETLNSIMKRKEKTPQNKLDYSRVELLIGLSDQDEFQVQGHLNHLFRYEKKSNAIIDENGELISGEMLLYVINHPEKVVNHGTGLNSCQVLSEMLSKHVLYGLMFLLIGVFSLTQSVVLMNLQFNTGMLFYIFLLISVLGFGINLGVMTANIILNKELFL